MQAQSTVTKCLAAILFTVGAAASFPLHSQGVLIGGVLGALSTPSYYPAPLGPHTGSLPHTSNPHPPDSSPGAWIADNWQHFGGPRRDSAERRGAEGSQFVEKWQQFFEPAR